jgi:uncharacterized membrane protein
MEMRNFVELAGNAAEIAGVTLIVGGFVVAALRYVVRTRKDAAPYQRLRQDLGRAILLGLEVLVAADIIRTVAFTPTMNSVVILAMIVAIRTFLSWSLALELEGRWPWRRQKPQAIEGADYTRFRLLPSRAFSRAVHSQRRIAPSGA